jgi:hypothetical protein
MRAIRDPVRTQAKIMCRAAWPWPTNSGAEEAYTKDA